VSLPVSIVIPVHNGRDLLEKLLASIHRQTAALYDVFPAHDRPIKPAGEWNTSEVIVKGSHVEHILNGKKVLEYELDSPELRAAIAKSKFKDIARFGKPQDGHILIQDHGDQVWFRKIEIKKTK